MKKLNMKGVKGMKGMKRVKYNKNNYLLLSPFYSSFLPFFMLVLLLVFLCGFA